jgi:hypothetical protein
MVAHEVPSTSTGPVRDSVVVGDRELYWSAQIERPGVAEAALAHLDYFWNARYSICNG